MVKNLKVIFKDFSHFFRPKSDISQRFFGANEQDISEKMYSDNRNSPENRSAVRRFVEKTILFLSFMLKKLLLEF